MTMMYETEREELCRYAKQIFNRKLTNAGGGNFSVRVSDEHFIITPTKISHNLWEVTPAQILVMDMDGNQIEGVGRPSGETNLHLNCYKENPGIKCVIHGHSLQSLVFSTLGINMPNLIESTQKLGEIKVLDFAPATSEELAEIVRKEVAKDQKVESAYLLRRHGTVITGKDLKKTYDLAERVEWNAYVALQYMLLKPNYGHLFDDMDDNLNFNLDE